MLPDCNEVIPLSILIFGVGVGVISQVPSVIMAWYAGRRGWALTSTDGSQQHQEARQ